MAERKCGLNLACIAGVFSGGRVKFSDRKLKAPYWIGKIEESLELIK